MSGKPAGLCAARSMASVSKTSEVASRFINLSYSNCGKTARFAIPATSNTTNSIYLRFDLLLGRHRIAGIMGGCFMPPAVDAAKCQAVVVSRYSQHCLTPTYRRSFQLIRRFRRQDPSGEYLNSEMGDPSVVLRNNGGLHGNGAHESGTRAKKCR